MILTIIGTLGNESCPKVKKILQKVYQDKCYLSIQYHLINASNFFLKKQIETHLPDSLKSAIFLSLISEWGTVSAFLTKSHSVYTSKWMKEARAAEQHIARKKKKLGFALPIYHECC